MHMDDSSPPVLQPIQPLYSLSKRVKSPQYHHDSPLKSHPSPSCSPVVSNSDHLVNHSDPLVGSFTVEENHALPFSIVPSFHSDYSCNDEGDGSSGRRSITPPMPVLVEGQCYTDFDDDEDDDELSNTPGSPLPQFSSENNIDKLESDIEMKNSASKAVPGNIWDRIAAGFAHHVKNVSSNNAPNNKHSPSSPAFGIQDYITTPSTPPPPTTTTTATVAAPATTATAKHEEKNHQESENSSSHPKRIASTRISAASKRSRIFSDDVYEFTEDDNIITTTKRGRTSITTDSPRSITKKPFTKTIEKKDSIQINKTKNTKFVNSSADNNANALTTTTNSSSQGDRRYLLGPYITHNDSSSIPSTSTDHHHHHSNKDDLSQQNVGNSYRVVNPALRDPVTGLDIGSSLCFRPQLKPPKPQELTCHEVWKCIFCGRPSSFVAIGCLFGPYYLTPNELQRIPSKFVLSPQDSTVYTTSIPLKSHSNGDLKLVIKPADKTSTTSATGIAESSLSSTTASSSLPKRISLKFHKSPPHNSSSTPPPATTTSTTTSPLRNNTKTTTTRQKEALNNNNNHHHDIRLSSDGDVWFHLQCVLFSPGTFMTGDGTIGGLVDAVTMALDATCIQCGKVGAMLSCRIRGCSKSYHYYCAVEADCAIDHASLSIVCMQHKHNISTTSD